MLTRYPERFGALFCTIPLIDMRRYTKLLAGASWIAEYGDPDKPEDWALLQTFRLSRRGPGQNYPPILLATTAATTACIPATPARWRPSCRPWDTKPSSTSRRPAATATARTTASAPGSSRSATRS